MLAAVYFTTAVHTKCEGMLSGDEIGKDLLFLPDDCSVSQDENIVLKLFLENCTLNIR